MFYCFLFCLPLSCVGVNLQVYLQNYLFLFSPQPKDPFKFVRLWRWMFTTAQIAFHNLTLIYCDEIVSMSFMFKLCVCVLQSSNLLEYHKKGFQRVNQ